MFTAYNIAEAVVMMPIYGQEAALLINLSGYAPALRSPWSRYIFSEFTHGDF